MRRFSQRQSLVTLSDINITPLLDLAFVLLIIFVITTPLLEQGINLNLPQGGVEDVKIDPKNVQTIDASTNGWYFAGGAWRTLDQVTSAVTMMNQSNPELLVYVRAGEDTPYKFVAALLSSLERAGVDKVSLRTDPVE
jgi:biopolymer transport protein ExbD/biopolymer transport protein TolR